MKKCLKMRDEEIRGLEHEILWWENMYRLFREEWAKEMLSEPVEEEVWQEQRKDGKLIYQVKARDRKRDFNNCRAQIANRTHELHRRQAEMYQESLKHQ